MIVMMERLSASEEVIVNVFDSASDAEDMAALLREEADSPAELATPASKSLIF